MIDFAKVRPGDILAIAGAGAPGFAILGDLVRVKSCDGIRRCDVIHTVTGEEAYFALTCGAARLAYAQGIEARQGGDAVAAPSSDESPVGNADAPRQAS